MRHTNAVRAAPWDKLVLNNPVQLAHPGVAGFPVAVQREDLARQLVDGHDVRRTHTLRQRVVIQAQVAGDLVHTAQTVNVLNWLLAALDLVVGLF